jgi:hypothetical protein
MIQRFKAAMRAGVPLVAIETADPAMTITGIRKAVNGKVKAVQWDLIRGISGFPDDADTQAVAQELTGGVDDTTNPVQALDVVYHQ